MEILGEESVLLPTMPFEELVHELQHAYEREEMLHALALLHAHPVCGL